MYPVTLMLISQHWLSPILGFPLVVYLCFVMRREEQANLVEFGEDYRQYMERVPRTNFVAGVVRLLRCRRLGAYEGQQAKPEKWGLSAAG